MSAFRVRVEDQVFDLHRPYGSTTFRIEHEPWPECEFGLWLPENLSVGDRLAWANKEKDALQAWGEVEEGTWRSSLEVPGLTVQSTLITHVEGQALWLRNEITNRGDTPVHSVNVDVCLHLVDAPRFISIYGERLWAHLDGGWRSTDTAQRELSPDPRRVEFDAPGLSAGRQAAMFPDFGMAILPEKAEHPLFIAEALHGAGSVGIASRNLWYLFNNNDPILRCIHSHNQDLEMIPPGTTAGLDHVILFDAGGRRDLLERYDEVVLPRWAAMEAI